jgi:magnesium transporter
VVFLPPALVASVWGMNATLGYPLSLVFMVVSAVVPFFFFRWKGWL